MLIFFLIQTTPTQCKGKPKGWIKINGKLNRHFLPGNLSLYFMLRTCILSPGKRRNDVGVGRGRSKDKLSKSVSDVSCCCQGNLSATIYKQNLPILNRSLSHGAQHYKEVREHHDSKCFYFLLNLLGWAFYILFCIVSWIMAFSSYHGNPSVGKYSYLLANRFIQL